MKNRVITISREFGSGGRTIGKETAKKLGIPCYDQELIERAAQESGFAKEYIAREGEYTGGGKWFSNAYAGIGSNYKMSNQDQLWLIQRKMILDIAEKESCVIVGRCADYILKDAADCLKVFIHADMEKRAERIVKIYGESDAAPEKRLKEKDKRRSAYYRFYTEMEWGQAKNYHLCLDSGALGIETCASILVGLY
ncbi:MAG: cytidylate kinase-like family protein [Lachnospiraceae bacterium]|nr:cytidylate kinase-like family protein [Lachnospiraceae bacterium]